MARPVVIRNSRLLRCCSCNELAIRDNDAALRLDPSDAQAYFNRGVGYQAMARYVEAARDFGETIRLQPTNAIAWGNRCRDRAILGELAPALADCNEALRLQNGNPLWLDARGLVKRGTSDAGAESDIAGATAIDADIAGKFGR